MNRPIAMQMIRNALLAVGTQEEGNNSGDEIEFYLSQCRPPLGPGNPWCAAFVRAMMKTAATQLNTTYDTAFPRSAYTPDWANYAKRNNLWVPVSAIRDGTSVPRKGDIALFYFSQLGRIGHIGIVIDVHPTYMWTIEGNTSPEPDSDGVVERDGDGVYKKHRQWNELGKFGGILRVNFLKNFIARLLGVKVAPETIEDACKLFGVEYEPVKTFQDACKTVDLPGEFAAMDYDTLRKVFVSAAKELRKRN